jgi:hypothetical protein
MYWIVHSLDIPKYIYHLFQAGCDELSLSLYSVQWDLVSVSMSVLVRTIKLPSHISTKRGS